MDNASRADATPAAGHGDSTGGRVLVRTAPPVPGAGIGLPQIRARSALAPSPVPSLEGMPPGREVDEAVVVEPPPLRNEPAITPTPTFPPGVAAKLGNYVYLLVDPRTGRPFFVGTGTGDRCHRHVQAARTVASSTKPSKFPLLDRVAEAEASGRAVRVEILRHGLTPSEADLVQASVADALGLTHPTGLGAQRGPAVDVGAQLAKRARIKRAHQVVLLRTGPYGTSGGYDAVRHGWRIGRRWVDVDSPRSPRWAVIVAGDLVESVYRIDRWDPSPSPSASASGVERFSFVGTPDPGLDERYAGRNVGPYLGAGTPSAVTYVWCGPHWVNTAT